METFEGTILKYIFFNENNGYSVILLEDGNSVVGNLPKLDKGDTVKFTGNWVRHPQYGLQFKAERALKKYPTTKDGIQKYLSSGAIKGINKKLAERIVARFGENTLEIIRNNPQELLQIKGIGPKNLERILESWNEKESIHSAQVFLAQYGISGSKALKIFKFYENETELLLRENPYRMIYEIEGIGFPTADSFAQNLGFEAHHPYRIEAWIIYYLREASFQGHVFIPFDYLENAAGKFLQINISEETEILNSLEEKGLIKIQENKIYLADLYLAERGIEKHIERLQAHKRNFLNASNITLQKIENIFTEEQIAGIKSVLSNNITIITGGPGTGKTTAIKGIIEIFKENNRKILAAAPTGRAAKRIHELIGLEAKTIHRLLEFNPFDLSFFYNEENPLNADLLIVDEVSMIDTYLMYHLLSALKESTTLVLVGDSNQLPSVGPGNILNDLIDSGKVPVSRFTKIFRQAEKSGIVKLAHAINSGIIDEFTPDAYEDIIFIEKNESRELTRLITELVTNRIPAKYGYDPLEDVQVLSPMYKGPAGVNELNASLQLALNKSVNPNRASKFQVGDKVMQLRNDYEKNIFNGDIGFVEKVDMERKNLIVAFEWKKVSYKFDETEDLTLAYAITVHKSQGGEYPCVVMPLTFAHRIMLKRKLLYTAVTRAKELLILIGTKRALEFAAQNITEETRFSSLFSDSSFPL